MRRLDRDLLLRAAADGAFMLFARTVAPAGLRAPGDDEEPEEEAEEAEPKAPTATGRTPVIASTAAPDRYGDIIVQDGWMLDNYRANPVIMPFHNYASPPVGRGENINVVGEDGARALAMDIVWDTGHELGATLARQYAEGFMRGVSVGFRPVDFAERAKLGEDDPRRADVGFVIERAELLELSAAPVPVQQEALAAKALSLGYGVEAVATPDDTDAGVLRALRAALRNDPETQRAVRQLFRAFDLARPDLARPSSPTSAPRTFTDAAAWLAS